jgi:hypothetical protein
MAIASSRRSSSCSNVEDPSKATPRSSN